MKDLDRKVGPAPIKIGELVGILSSRCGLSPDSLSCREFKPLFVDHKSSCAAHLSMATCLVSDKCTWFLNSCTSKAVSCRLLLIDAAYSFGCRQAVSKSAAAE